MIARGSGPRLFVALIVGCLLGALATACGSPPVPTVMTLVPVTGGSLTVGIDQAPTGCNPNTPAGDTWADQLILEAVLPGAYIVSNNGQVIPDQNLVTSAEVTSQAPQTVVYTLDARARWSDGTPITAADFVYAWHQQRSASGTAASIAGYRDIRSVKGSDHGHSVTVVFVKPFTDWRMLFDDLLPAHVLTRTGWNPACRSVDPAVDLSGGPFAIQAVTPDQVDLVANRRWWGQAPELDHLTIKIARSPHQLARWLADGTAQVIEPSGFDRSLLADLDADSDTSTTVEQSSTFVQLEFSTVAADTATADMRLAVARAVDRRALVDRVVGWATSGIVPAASHLAAQSESSYPNTQSSSASSLSNPLDAGPTSGSSPFPTTATLAQSARLLGDAGYVLGPAGTWLGPDGAPLTLHLAVDVGDPWVEATSGPLVAQLQRAGFAVAVIPEPSTALTGATLLTGAADVALLPMAATAYPSQAIAWYTELLGPPGTGGSQDWPQFVSPTLDSLLTRAVRALNPVTGAPLYQQADQLLWSQMVALPLFTEPTLLGVSDHVHGVGPNPFGAGLLWFPASWGTQTLEPTTATT